MFSSLTNKDDDDESIFPQEKEPKKTTKVNLEKKQQQYLKKKLNTKFDNNNTEEEMFLKDPKDLYDSNRDPYDDYIINYKTPPCGCGPGICCAHNNGSELVEDVDELVQFLDQEKVLKTTKN